MKSCLCVIFNHYFPGNIPALRRLYAGRFSHVRFIQPMLQSSDPDVITVYRGSFTHGAYVSDSLGVLTPLDCERYIFIHDDVLLSPGVNEANIDEVFSIQGGDAFIGGFKSSEPEDIGRWGYWPGTLWRMLNPRNLLSGTGVDSWHAAKMALPPAEDALRRVQKLGLGVKTLMRTGDSLS